MQFSLKTLLLVMFALAIIVVVGPILGAQHQLMSSLVFYVLQLVTAYFVIHLIYTTDERRAFAIGVLTIRASQMWAQSSDADAMALANRLIWHWSTPLGNFVYSLVLFAVSVPVPLMSLWIGGWLARRAYRKIRSQTPPPAPPAPSRRSQPANAKS